MPRSSDDPITRALIALDRLHAAHPDQVEATVWQEARSALAEAQGERFTFLVVVAAARKLIADLETYGAAPEDEDVQVLAGLAAACTAAEGALAKALGNLGDSTGVASQPWSEEAFLVALDHVADDEDSDDNNDNDNSESPS